MGSRGVGWALGGGPRVPRPRGAHLQRLAPGPLVLQLQPHVLQVPPARPRGWLRWGRAQQGAPGDPQGPFLGSAAPPHRPHPHSQVLASHQVHEDVQGPHLSLQVLQGQPLLRALRCGGERGAEPGAGRPQTPPGHAGRPLARHPGARGRGVAQLGRGHLQGAEAIGVCKREGVKGGHGPRTPRWHLPAWPYLGLRLCPAPVQPRRRAGGCWAWGWQGAVRWHGRGVPMGSC